jgi:hypothetical protein
MKLHVPSETINIQSLHKEQRKKKKEKRKKKKELNTVDNMT